MQKVTANYHMLSINNYGWKLSQHHRFNVVYPNSPPSFAPAKNAYVHLQNAAITPIETQSLPQTRRMQYTSGNATIT